MKKYFLLLLTMVGGIISFSTYGQSIVKGKVTDKNGESLIGVTIVLKSNKSIGSVTDFDGNYILKINDTSSSQTLIVSYISYETQEETIQTKINDTIIKDFVLLESSKQLVEVEVVGKSSKAKDYYMEDVKKNSASSIDFISSETMKKTGDQNVTAAIARVSGVSSTSSGFITVRGIGDRYVKTTINGLRIPTLDPYTNNIRLDLIPSNLVDNIIITKTASPDLPGDWAGAYISVETKDYPDKLSVNVESSFGYNTQSTFKDVITSQRSNTDWLGYDSGRDHTHDQSGTPVTANLNPTQYQEFEALGLGNYYKSIGVDEYNWKSNSETYYKLGLVQLGLLSKGGFNDPVAVADAKEKYYNGPYEMEAFDKINAKSSQLGQSFPDNWNNTTRKAPMNFSQSFSIGNQVKLFGKPLGFITGFRYGSNTQYDPNSHFSRAGLDANLNRTTTDSAQQQVARETNGWSALFNMAYKYHQNHSISLMFMPNLTGVNNVRNATGISDDPYFTKSSIIQFYEQRQQMVYQLKSEHYIPGPKIKIELNASYTNGKSKAPDFKNLDYLTDSSGTSVISPAIGVGIHRYYRYLSDNLFDSKLGIEFPLFEKPELPRKIKIGAAYQRNDRKNDQYDYSLNFGGPKTSQDATFKDENINGLFTLDKFNIQNGVDDFGHSYSYIDYYYSESGSPINHTFGSSDIKAVYGMTDFTIIRSLRFSGGLRAEQATIFTDVVKYDSLGYASNDHRRNYNDALPSAKPANLNGLNFLPSASLIYKIKRDESAPMNLRVNYSQTVARPSIRELSDISLYDAELRGYVVGNSDLKMVHIYNYDLRYEAAFKNKDNVSFSLFYKDVRNNIEIVNYGFYSWKNVDKSKVKGIELEGKKVITKHFDLRVNVTFVESSTTFIPTRLDILNGNKIFHATGDSLPITRPMFGQSPYIYNGIIGYTADSIGLNLAISYNVQGPKLSLASSMPVLPDGKAGIPDVYELPRHLLNFKATKTLGKHYSISITVQDILNSPIRRAYKYPEGFKEFGFDSYRYGTTYMLNILYKL